MAGGVRVREIVDVEGKRLVRIVRRGSGSVVTWRRAQVVLLSARRMNVAGIARVAFTSEGHVRDVIHNFKADEFGPFKLHPRLGRVRTATAHAGDVQPRTFTWPGGHLSS